MCVSFIAGAELCERVGEKGRLFGKEAGGAEGGDEGIEGHGAGVATVTGYSFCGHKNGGRGGREEKGREIRREKGRVFLIINYDIPFQIFRSVSLRTDLTPRSSFLSFLVPRPLLEVSQPSLVACTPLLLLYAFFLLLLCSRLPSPHVSFPRSAHSHGRVTARTQQNVCGTAGVC